jgi:O-antigen/teichoic acid export membrane protein
VNVVEMLSIIVKVHQGLKWGATAMVIGRLTRFLASVALARILLPEMFGMLAMAYVVIETIAIIRQFGFGAAFIQKEEKDEFRARVLGNTTFIMGLSLNLFLFGVCFASAQLIADFLNEPRLVAILQVMFCAFLLDALSTTPRLILRKRLEFNKFSICEILQCISESVFAIALAFLGFGVWSLVFGHLAAKTIQTFMVFKLSGWRPRLEFDAQMAWELFGYGKYIWAFVIVTAAGNAIDKAFAGRFYGTASLGLFYMAFNLCSLPPAQLSALVNRVAFPAFSEIQKDRKLLRKAFFKTISHVSVISFPIAFGMMALSEELVLTVLGKQWLSIEPLVYILVFFGISRSLTSISGPVFKAIGKPNILLYVTLIFHLLKIGLILLLRNYGLPGICYAILISSILAGAITFYYISALLGLSVKSLLEPVIRSAAASTVMFLVIVGLGRVLNIITTIPAGISLAGLTIIGMGVYALVSCLVNRSVLFEFKNTIFHITTS